MWQPAGHGKREQAARTLPGHRLGNGANVVGRGGSSRPARHQAFGSKLMHLAAGDFGRFIKAGVAHGVGQASVGVA